MNALALIAAVAVAFFFGYRFYARLLALDIFRLDKNYSTAASAPAGARDTAPINRHVLFAHHVTAMAGATAFAGPIAVAAWGWVPAFLWLVVGTAVATGTHAFGSFWLAAYRPGNIDRIAGQFFGKRARWLLLLLASLVLLMVIVASAGLGATLLAAYPGAVLPFWTLILVALCVGPFLSGRDGVDLFTTGAIGIAVVLLSVWAFGHFSIALTGSVQLALNDIPWLSLDSAFLWTLALLFYALYAARAPISRLTRPRSFIVGLLLALMLITLFLALAIRHPDLTAPQFHAPMEAGPLPWLFLLMTSGAFAGFQLLLIYGVNARQSHDPANIRFLGYGGALAEGAIALSALLLAATAFAGGTPWTEYFATPPSAADFPKSLRLYVDHYARHASTFGLDVEFLRHLAATVVAGVALVLTETGMRALKHLWLEYNPPAAGTANGKRFDERKFGGAMLGGCIAIALYGGRGLGGIDAWPLFALSSLWLAGIGLVVMAQVLRVEQRTYMLIAALAAAIFGIAVWGSFVQLRTWLHGDTWLPAGILLVVLLGVLRLAIDIARGWKTTASVSNDAPPPT